MGNSDIQSITGDLIVLNFFPALGTNEIVQGQPSAKMVTTGTPLTWDTNNGLVVIYDDIGHPWIRSRSYLSPEWELEIVKEHELKRGAYVPHSNDGGTFKKKLREQTGVHI